MRRIIENFIVNFLLSFVLINIFNFGQVDSLLNIVLFALIFTILGFTIRPLLQIISLPLTAITFGIFFVFVNIFIVFITDAVTWGVDIRGFLNNLIVSLVLFGGNSLLNSYRLKRCIEKI